MISRRLLLMLAAAITIAIGCFTWAFVINYTTISSPQNPKEDPVVIKEAAARAREEYVALVTAKLPKHFDSAWVMSSSWFGYMGVAIAISEDRYFYWMYSDVGGDGDYPYVGQYSIKDGILRLGDPTSLVTGKSIEKDDLHSLYSEEWKIIKERLTTNLHSITDKPDDYARTLILDVQFDPQNPFRNQDDLKCEQVVPPNGP